MNFTYLPALDALRFFASLNVVLLHFSSSHLLSYAKGTFFEKIIHGPFFSTAVFFLLSGFIYSILFEKRERKPKLIPFMKERFWRLYPLHLICTLLIFAVLLYRTHVFDNPAYAVKTLALHISLLWAFVPELGHHLNQPSWALSVFFLCYALTPAFFKFMSKLNKKIIWGLLLSTWLVSLFVPLYFNEIPRTFAGINFFSGMLLGKLFADNSIPLPKKARLNDLLLVFVIILLCLNICLIKPVNHNFAYYSVSPVLYSAFMLFLANNKGLIVGIFSVSWLRSVGKASFYTYLLHCVVINFLHLYTDKVAHWRYNPFDNPVATVIIMVLLYGGCTLYSRFMLKRKKRSF